MSILNTLKLASTLIVMAVGGVAAISPAFDFGIFIGGVTLGGYLFLQIETY